MAEQGVRNALSGDVRLLAVCLAVLLSATLGALWVRSRRNATLAVNAELTIPEKSLDFGEVWVQPSFQWTLPIHNPREADVEILDIKSSCSCSSVEPRSVLVRAGETVSVRLDLDLGSKDLSKALLRSRPFEVTLVPQIKGPMAPRTLWRVKGRVLSPFLALPECVHFREPLILGTPFASMSFAVECTDRATRLLAQCSDSLAAVCVSQPDGVSKHFRVEVIPAPRLEAEDYRFEVILKAQLAGDNAVAVVSVPVVARVEQDVIATPHIIVRGVRSLGEVLEETVTLSARKRPFDASAVPAGNGDDFEIEPIKVSSDRLEHRFRIRQRVAKCGPSSVECRFRIAHVGTYESYVIAVPLMYHGTTSND